MRNKVQLFVRRILQNSQVNREKFVMNKKLYNNQKKPIQWLQKRKFGTHIPPDPKNTPEGPNIFILIAVGAFICVGLPPSS